MKKFLAGAAMLLLAGCFDVDVTMDFTGDDNVEVLSTYKMSRELYAMMQDGETDDCEDGEKSLTEEYYTCSEVEKFTVTELLEQEGDSVALPGQEEEMPMIVERIDDDILRIVIPLGDLMEGMGDDEEMPPEMLVMFKEAMLGHGMKLTIRGQEIMQTNGEVSEDGRSAVLNIPLVELLEEKPEIPEEFIVVVKTP